MRSVPRHLIRAHHQALVQVALQATVLQAVAHRARVVAQAPHLHRQVLTAQAHYPAA